jgi:hypothetical protein
MDEQLIKVAPGRWRFEPDSGVRLLHDVTPETMWERVREWLWPGTMERLADEAIARTCDLCGYPAPTEDSRADSTGGG